MVVTCLIGWADSHWRGDFLPTIGNCSTRVNRWVCAYSVLTLVDLRGTRWDLLICCYSYSVLWETFLKLHFYVRSAVILTRTSVAEASRVKTAARLSLGLCCSMCAARSKWSVETALCPSAGGSTPTPGGHAQSSRVRKPKVERMKLWISFYMNVFPVFIDRIKMYGIYCCIICPNWVLLTGCFFVKYFKFK